jgi:hypothetical protein
VIVDPDEIPAALGDFRQGHAARAGSGPHDLPPASAPAALGPQHDGRHVPPGLGGRGHQAGRLRAPEEGPRSMAVGHPLARQGEARTPPRQPKGVAPGPPQGRGTVFLLGHGLHEQDPELGPSHAVAGHHGLGRPRPVPAGRHHQRMQPRAQGRHPPSLAPVPPEPAEQIPVRARRREGPLAADPTQPDRLVQTLQGEPSRRVGLQPRAALPDLQIGIGHRRHGLRGEHPFRADPAADDIHGPGPRPARFGDPPAAAAPRCPAPSFRRHAGRRPHGGRDRCPEDRPGRPRRLRGGGRLGRWARGGGAIRFGAGRPSGPHPTAPQAPEVPPAHGGGTQEHQAQQSFPQARPPRRGRGNAGWASSPTPFHPPPGSPLPWRRLAWYPREGRDPGQAVPLRPEGHRPSSGPAPGRSRWPRPPRPGSCRSRSRLPGGRRQGTCLGQLLAARLRRLHLGRQGAGRLGRGPTSVARVPGGHREVAAASRTCTAARPPAGTSTGRGPTGRSRSRPRP